MADGPHTIDVRAIDHAGNIDATPARRSVTVDTIAPNTTIDTARAARSTTTRRSSPSRARRPARASSAASIAAAFAACTSPRTLTSLADGAHTFRVRAKDGAGNLDGTPASNSFTVDTAAPQTTIDSGPTGPTNDNTPTWAFSATRPRPSSAGSTTGRSRPARSPFTPTALSDGTHTFEVRATDAALNQDGTPASRSIIVDTIAPDAPVITFPAENQLLATSTVGVRGTAEAGTTVTVFEDTTSRGSVIAGTAPWEVVVGAVPDGTHTYTARAQDAAGNTSVSLPRTFRVDAALPDTTIADGPTSPTNDATPTFTFTSTEAGTYECSIDGGGFTACTTPFTTPALPSGEHTLTVRAVDTAGNRDNTAATRTFVIDLTPPAEPNITSGPSGPVTDPSPAFAFAATDTVECKLDGPNGAPGAFGDCVSPKSFSNLAAGEYLFTRPLDRRGRQPDDELARVHGDRAPAGHPDADGDRRRRRRLRRLRRSRCSTRRWSSRRRAGRC